MRVLVIAAHPDDAEIGMGGQIKFHVDARDEVEILLFTAGELGCPGLNPEDTASIRTHEAFNASKFIGSRIYKFLEQPDGGVSNNHEIMLETAKAIADRKPDRIYVTNINDSHPDHQAAAQIVKECVEKSFIQPEVWMYEIWTPFQTYDQLIDITEVIGVKIKAIRMHESQVNRIRFDEAALSLARWRGELHNRPNGPYAEAFQKLF